MHHGRVAMFIYGFLGGIFASAVLFYFFIFYQSVIPPESLTRISFTVIERTANSMLKSGHSLSNFDDLRPSVPSGALMDAWGTAIHVELDPFSEIVELRFSFRSAGPDRLMNTEDDVTDVRSINVDPLPHSAPVPE